LGNAELRQALPLDVGGFGNGEEVFPGIWARVAPGHLIFILKGCQHDIIFIGDAAKNRAELVSGDTDMTYDAAVSAATINMIRDLWRTRSGSIVVPGHDLPMAIEGGEPRYLGKRQAAIRAWFSDVMETTTLIELIAPQ
jgi:hypothetical protein